MKLFHKQRETERKPLYNISYIFFDHVFLYNYTNDTGENVCSLTLSLKEINIQYSMFTLYSYPQCLYIYTSTIHNTL